ncbi:MAG TPA: hypothetical protein VK821_10920 [Dehalococcoidia bacterium]|nr:hypothetical protein [Dehalococcoidia bacterium]
MTADPAFTQRVVRLVCTSALVLGLMWWLSLVTLKQRWLVTLSLGAAWLLMPCLLALSLRRPALRRGLVIPSALASLGLIAICTGPPSSAAGASAGWRLVTGGVLVGALLGGWFWFRWLPVPRSLEDPFSAGRWLLIGVHVSLVVAGLALVGHAALT